MELNERVAKLEADDETLFSQLTEVKNDVKVLNRLTVAVEKIAIQTETTAQKVDNIDSRLNNLESEPGQRLVNLKTAVTTAIATGIVGGLLTYFFSVVLK